MLQPAYSFSSIRSTTSLSCSRLRRPACAPQDATAAEKDERRHRLNVVASNRFGIFEGVDVDLEDIHAPHHLLPETVEHGVHHLTGAAPRGVKVDHGGQVALVFPLGIFRIVEDLLLKRFGCQFDCFHGLLVFRF